MSLSKLFAKDVLKIYDSLDIGACPELSDDEKSAINIYPMKWKGPMTPLLR